MFALCSNIEMGRFKGIKPNSVKITKSMFDFVDKAVIKLPITARIKQAGEVISESVETARQFNEGDKVVIKLGYNGSLKEDYTGFIHRINYTQPLEVECEGYSYQLRQKTYNNTFVKTKLKQILEFLIAGTDITLDVGIPDFVFDKMSFKNHNGVEALQKIKKESSDTICIFFTGNVLYAGLAYLKPKADVKYQLGWNVIKDNNLKKREAKNQDVTVHFIGEKKDGSKVQVQGGKKKTKPLQTNASSGTTGETVVFKSHSITDENSLKMASDAKLKQLSFDGYEGKITAFGIPYCEPGYRAKLDDKKYPERSGNYIVESTEINYSTSGFRRIVGIGAKL